MTTTLLTSDTTSASGANGTGQPALPEVRRAALRQFATPCEDDGELAHHLLARYLLRSSRDPGRRVGQQGTPELLASFGALFAAVADRRRLRSDDLAVLALAAVLLQDPAASPVPRQGGPDRA